ncbi:MAG: STAS domain-containing protein [Thermoplasmata archaeon]|nr:MAG: STAS domain-containing protein [Thermoplasmata archaeon]
MELDFKTKRDLGLVIVKGKIDANTALDLESRLNSIISDKKFKLIIDMKDVDFISSAGLRVLLAGLKETKKNDGELVLVGLQPQVKEVFDITGFTSLFKCCSNVKDAEKMLK